MMYLITPPFWSREPCKKSTNQKQGPEKQLVTGLMVPFLGKGVLVGFLVRNGRSTFTNYKESQQ